MGTALTEAWIGLGNTSHMPGWAPHIPQNGLHLEWTRRAHWARKVGSKKYSELSIVYKWWGAVAQISTVTDDLKVLYFWF